MKSIELTDEVVLPVMQKHGVSREEAEKRLQLLYKSSILEHGHPEDPSTQRLIDSFLSQDSETLENTVSYEQFFSECLNNADLVREYDRLNFSSLGKSIRKANAGLPPTNFKRQLEAFERFLHKTIIPRLEKESGK